MTQANTTTATESIESVDTGNAIMQASIVETITAKLVESCKGTDILSDMATKLYNKCRDMDCHFSGVATLKTAIRASVYYTLTNSINAIAKHYERRALADDVWVSEKPAGEVDLAKSAKAYITKNGIEQAQDYIKALQAAIENAENDA